jgi:multidrug transporter EmrE-like cation transporter
MRAAALLSIVGLILLAPATAQAGWTGYAPLSAEACESPSFNPADEPPFGGQTLALSAPLPQGARPAAFRLTAGQATAIATEALTPAGSVRRFEARTRTGPDSIRQWQIDYFDPGGKDVGQVVINDQTGCVLEKWTGTQVDTKLARGYEGAVSGKVNKWWIWLPLCVLFLAPFVDPRRPLRLIHLDLLSLLGFSVSLFFFNKAKIELSVGLIYPVLGYLFLRMLVAGFLPREHRDKLLPLAPRGLLVAGIVALGAFHTAYIATEGKVIDVGLAGVIGADRLTHGDDVYGEGASSGMPIRGDVYGPVNYLAYVPFELVLPWSGHWDDVPAARAAALGFELLTALALYLLGCRLWSPWPLRWWQVNTFRAVPRGPTDEARTLGLALAYAWLAYPFTMYTLGSSFNDALVAFLVVCCLLVVSAPARGVWAALAGLSKFGPLILTPLLAGGSGDRRPRALVLFGLGFLVAAAVVTLPLLPDGGFRELYDRSLGYQASRGSPFSVWGQAPSLHALQTVTKVGAVALAAALFFVPRRRTTVQLAALGAALLIAVQVTANHWFFPYTVWFAPLVLVVIFAQRRGPEAGIHRDLRATAPHV